jgi:flagellar biosynthesis/type III secretory pathway protein FliH
MGGEREWETVMRQAQDDLEAAQAQRWRRGMADEVRVRGAKQLEEGYRAGFRDGYEVGLADADVMRGLRDRVAGESAKKLQDGLERLRGQVKPRRTRRVKTHAPADGV